MTDNYVTLDPNGTIATDTEADDTIYKVSIALTCFRLFLIPVICTGNLLTCLVIFRYQHLHTHTNALVASLAATDLVIGMVFVPTSSLPLIVGDSVLKNRFFNLFMKGPYYYTLYLQLINLVAIALDRYIAIVYPYKYAVLITKRSVGVVITCMWLLPLPGPICFMVYWNT